MTLCGRRESGPSCTGRSKSPSKLVRRTDMIDLTQHHFYTNYIFNSIGFLFVTLHIYAEVIVLSLSSICPFIVHMFLKLFATCAK